jgi:membrane-associated phospholipid phosphatase
MDDRKDTILYGALAASTAGFVMVAPPAALPATSVTPASGFAQHAAMFFSGLFHPAALLILALGGALYLRALGRRNLSVIAGCAVSLTALLAVSLKYVFGTPRPDSGLVPAAGPSFPSAHAAVSVIVAILFAYAFSVLHKKQRIDRAVTIVVGAIAGAVVWSRLALGVHWPRDLWGGVFLGVAVASLALIIYARIHVSRSKNP